MSDVTKPNVHDDGRNPLRLLIVEGNTRDGNAAMAEFGLKTNAEQYAAAVHLCAPEAHIHTLRPADGDVELPVGVGLADFDGLILGGSGLFVRASGNAPEVQRQVDLLRAAFNAGLPVLGSCWGLQVAVIAAGGEVDRSPNGREVGICRNITRAFNDASDPFLADKPPIFASLCVHYDEVTRLPAGAQILASNDHSPIQAATFDYANGVFWGVQYHPEFDLAHMAGLIRRYADDLVDQGNFPNGEVLAAYADDLDALHRDPGTTDAANRLGIGASVVDHVERHREIGNWLEFCAARRMA